LYVFAVAATKTPASANGHARAVASPRQKKQQARIVNNGWKSERHPVRLNTKLHPETPSSAVANTAVRTPNIVRAHQYKNGKRTMPAMTEGKYTASGSLPNHHMNGARR
jgi:hypothetical protein